MTKVYADGSTLWLFSPGASLVEGVTQAPCPQVLEGVVDIILLYYCSLKYSMHSSTDAADLID